MSSSASMPRAAGSKTWFWLRLSSRSLHNEIDSECTRKQNYKWSFLFCKFIPLFVFIFQILVLVPFFLFLLTYYDKVSFSILCGQRDLQAQSANFPVQCIAIISRYLQKQDSRNKSLINKICIYIMRLHESKGILRSFLRRTLGNARPPPL